MCICMSKNAYRWMIHYYSCMTVVRAVCRESPSKFCRREFNYSTSLPHSALSHCNHTQKTVACRLLLWWLWFKRWRTMFQHAGLVYSVTCLLIQISICCQGRRSSTSALICVTLHSLVCIRARQSRILINNWLRWYSSVNRRCVSFSLKDRKIDEIG